MLLLLEKSSTPEIRLTRAVFIGSLIFLCRMDYAVILAPIVSLLCFQTKSVKKSLLGILVGGIPAFSWLLFSLIYYGTVFPNTYFAKLSTNIPKIQYLYQGLLYVYDSSLYDSFTLATIVTATIYTIFFLKDNTRKSVATGVILYCLYIVNIGGDFMSGRYFAIPLYISVFLLSDLFVRLNRKSLIAVVMVAYFSCANIISISLPSSRVIHAHGINNEQAFYYGRDGNAAFSFGLLAPNRDYPDVTNWRRDTEPNVIDDVQIRCGLLGNHALSSKPNTHWIDPCGLTDPLLARLPIDTSIDSTDGNRFGWRIGHIKRRVPEGYAESIASGVNVIQDPDIARFYDLIKVVVSDPVFSRKRLVYLFKFSGIKTFEDFKSSSFKE
ncbi:hypothetical protein NIES208_00870 [[Limnothrix rosea] IAM M-220]|nr:hypothetical protein NIES208_00870 [[Limnothrix rosea] IAM M-220]